MRGAAIVKRDVYYVLDWSRIDPGLFRAIPLSKFKRKFLPLQLHQAESIPILSTTTHVYTLSLDPAESNVNVSQSLDQEHMCACV